MIMHVLLTDDGKVRPFYIKGMAEMYQTIYGGTIFVESETEESTIHEYVQHHRLVTDNK